MHYWDCPQKQTPASQLRQRQRNKCRGNNYVTKKYRWRGTNAITVRTLSPLDAGEFLHKGGDARKHLIALYARVAVERRNLEGQNLI